MNLGTRLLVKNELICETVELRRVTSGLFPLLISYVFTFDLMEQFMISITTTAGALAAAIAFLVPSILVILALGFFSPNTI